MKLIIDSNSQNEAFARTVVAAISHVWILLWRSWQT